jgi:hypothetical protein
MYPSDYVPTSLTEMRCVSLEVGTELLSIVEFIAVNDKGE